jgi:TonB family protein
MNSTVSRIRVLALSFSIALHLAAGVGIILLPDSRKASHTAPVKELSVLLEQFESAAESVSIPEPPVMPEPQAAAGPGATKSQLKKLLPKSRPNPKPVKKRVTKAVQREKIVAKAPEKAAEKTVAARAVTELQKAEYFSLLQAQIEGHKYYPRAARKLGIEGRVEVSFQLVKNAEVNEVVSSGAHRMLNHAAARAVRDALPFPPPPDGLQLPVKVQFSMFYQLKR